jgi:hypothetical protein
MIWSICVTNDHGYVPVVVTIRSFLHSWLITGFVTKVTRRVPHVEQRLLTLRSTWVHPRFFNGIRVAWSSVFWETFCWSLFVLLSFFCCPLYYLSFSDLRLLITPMVSSNFAYHELLDLLISSVKVQWLLY